VGPDYSYSWNSRRRQTGAHTDGSCQRPRREHGGRRRISVTVNNPLPLLQLQLDATEVSGVGGDERVGGDAQHRSGRVHGHGGGEQRRIGEFHGAQTGQTECISKLLHESNNAYYKFTGATIGNIFNVNQGQIKFYRSRDTALRSARRTHGSRAIPLMSGWAAGSICSTS